MSTGSGAVRSANASVLESLRIATVDGLVSLKQLVVGSRAVVQVRAGEGLHEDRGGGAVVQVVR